MSSWIRSLAATTLPVLLLAAGCDEKHRRATDVSAQRVQRSAEEAVDAIGDFARDEVARFRSDSERQLDELQHKLDEAGASTQERAQQGVEAARRHTDELRQQLRDLGNDASANWTEARQRLQRSLENLQREVSEFIDRARTPPPPPPPPTEPVPTDS